MSEGASSPAAASPSPAQRALELSAEPVGDFHSYAHIRTGYRRGYSFRQTVASVFEWHNETWNVWTHLLGFFLFAWLLTQVVQMEHAVSFVASTQSVRALHLSAHLEKLQHAYQALRHRVRDGIGEERIDAATEWARTQLPGHSQEALLGRAALVMSRTRQHLRELGHEISHEISHIGTEIGHFGSEIGQELSELGNELRHEISHLRDLATGRAPAAELSEAHTREGCGEASVDADGAPCVTLASEPCAHTTGCDAADGPPPLTCSSESQGGDSYESHDQVAAENEAERHLDSLRVELERLLTLDLGELRLRSPNLESMRARFAAAIDSITPSLGAHVQEPQLRLGPAETLHVERWPLYIFLASAMACLCASAVFHLFGTANARWANALGAFDYIGIILLILGSTIPIYHYGFYNAAFFRRLYLGAIYLCGGALLVCVQLDWFYTQRWRLLRIAMFIGLGVVGALPLLHVVIHHEFNEMSVQLATGVLAMGATYLIGVIVYAAGFPEATGGGRWNQNNRFDIHLSSHQFWHVAVVLAAYIHFLTVVELWESISFSHAANTMHATNIGCAASSGTMNPPCSHPFSSADGERAPTITR